MLLLRKTNRVNRQRDIDDNVFEPIASRSQFMWFLLFDKTHEVVIIIVEPSETHSYPESQTSFWIIDNILLLFHV